MIDPYDVFKYYMSVKLHFGGKDYDCIKYNFKTSVTQSSFYRRKDRYHFAKVGRKFNQTDDLIDFFVAQFIEDKEWIGDMLGKDGERVYARWLKRQESLTYLFEQDMNELSSNARVFDDLFVGSPYPAVVAAYLSDTVMIETPVILHKLTGFMNKADNDVSDPVVWPSLSRKIHKYAPFVHFDSRRIRDKILSIFSA